MPMRETLERIRSAPEPPNEETAKIQIVVPILIDMGWKTFDPNEALFEHPVGDKGKGKVDIALMGPNRLVALIEAKSPAQDLKPHVGQVLGYAFHEGVDICVLTNGLEWWLYLPLEKGPPKERRFTSLRIKVDPITQLTDDFNTFLSKENLVNGNAHKRAKQALQAKKEADFLNDQLPGIWKSMLTGPDDDLVELVRQRTYEKVNLRPDRKQVATLLRGSPVQPPCCVSGVPAKPAPIPPKPPNQRAKPKKPTGFRIWDEYYLFEKWNRMLISVGEALYRRHTSEFDRVLTLQGHKRPYASRNPDDLRAAHQVGSSGIYFETSLNAKGIEKRSYEFLALFDYPPSDLDILYE